MGLREKVVSKLFGVRLQRYVTTCTILSDQALSGKRILITGGTSGIGLAAARAISATGATTIVTGRDVSRFENVAKSLGANTRFCAWDQKNTRDIANKLDEIEALAGGPLDGLFLNAGIYPQKDESWQVDVFKDLISVNLESPCRIVMEQVQRWVNSSRPGSIVVNGSDRGLYPDTYPYGIEKAALHSFVQGIARDYGSSNIRLNAVAPGMTATGINNVRPDGDLSRFDEKAYRVIRPEEIAEVVLFLLSDRSTCINGVVLPCDLGNYLR